MIRRRRRMQLTAAVTVFLVLAGGTGATAYWTGQAQLQAQAGAASMGLELQVLPTAATSPLAVTYTAQNRIAAGAVTIRNTGSRTAASELSISAESPTSASLPAAISVVVAPVLAAADCTPQGTLEAPTVRALSTTSTSFPVTGALAVDATTILCVRTTLAADAAAPDPQSLRLAIDARLTYAAAPEWSTSSPLSRITQTVAAAPRGPDIQAYARYTIRNDGFCIFRAPAIARTATCPQDSSQWRIQGSADGTFQIVGVDPWRKTFGRWTAVRPGSLALQDGSPDGSTAQQWRITAAEGSTYRIESASIPGLCATIGDGLYKKKDVDPRRVVLAPCDPTSAAQVFSFEMVGTPVPPTPQSLTCTGSEWYIQLRFDAPVDYQGEIEYRVLLSREDSVGEPSGIRVWGGRSPGFGISADDPDLDSFATGNGVGNTRIVVEQSIAGTEWMTAAIGDVRTELVDGELRIWCGWQ